MERSTCSFNFRLWTLSKIDKNSSETEYLLLSLYMYPCKFGLAKEIHGQRPIHAGQWGCAIAAARFMVGDDDATTITPSFCTISSTWNDMLFRFPNGYCSSMRIMFSLSLSFPMSSALLLSFLTDDSRTERRYMCSVVHFERMHIANGLLF